MVLRNAVSLLAPAIAMFVIGCASGTATSHYTPVSVTSDYSGDTDFQTYKTYAWLPQPSVKKEPVLDRQIKAAVDSQLFAKGLQKSPTEPDLLLAYHTGVEDRVLASNLGYSYRSRYVRHRSRGVGFASSSDISTTTYQEGTLILDFIDASTKELIFRASAQAVLDRNAAPEDDEQLVNEAVAKMLENYPAKTNY